MTFVVGIVRHSEKTGGAQGKVAKKSNFLTLPAENDSMSLSWVGVINLMKDNLPES